MEKLLAPGTRLSDRYVVDGVAQVGDRCAVYHGHDSLGAAKAVIIRENLDTSREAQARFDQEAQLLASLEHSALPAVIDTFVELSGRQYLVLLQVEGPSLAEVLTRSRALPEANALALFDRLLDAIEYLHTRERPVVHGGISPLNIIIGPEGMPYLTGLAGVDMLPTPGAAAGQAESPYAAPEQHTGSMDARSDVYALGATLYALLTGQAPAGAQARTQGTSLKAPRQIKHQVSPRVEAAVLRAMAVEPEQRFSDVSEFRQALRQPAAPVVRPATPAPSRMLLIGTALATAIAVVLFGVVALPRLVKAARRLVAGSRAPSAVPTAKPTLVRPTPKVVYADTLSPEKTPTAGRPAPTKTKVVHLFLGPTATQAAAPAGGTKPRQPLPAPVLLSPQPDADIYGAIDFSWSWDHPLGADEYFDLQVYREGAQPAGIAWCKEPYRRVDTLFTGSGDYYWRVQVICGKDGKVLAPVSEASEQRAMDWHAHAQTAP